MSHVPIQKTARVFVVEKGVLVKSDETLRRGDSVNIVRSLTFVWNHHAEEFGEFKHYGEPRYVLMNEIK